MGKGRKPEAKMLGEEIERKTGKGSYVKKPRGVNSEYGGNSLKKYFNAVPTIQTTLQQGNNTFDELKNQQAREMEQIIAFKKYFGSKVSISL